VRFLAGLLFAFAVAALVGLGATLFSLTRGTAFGAFSIGANEMSTLDMASGIQTIANEGVHMEPYFVDYIDDAAGQRIYTHNDPGTPVLDRQVEVVRDREDLADGLFGGQLLADDAETAFVGAVILAVTVVALNVAGRSHRNMHAGVIVVSLFTVAGMVLDLLPDLRRKITLAGARAATRLSAAALCSAALMLGERLQHVVERFAFRYPARDFQQQLGEAQPRFDIVRLISHGRRESIDRFRKYAWQPE